MSEELDALLCSSQITGDTYLVTEWEDQGNGRIIAHEKREVEGEELHGLAREQWRAIRE